MTALLVTGSGPGVGTTVVAAAVAALALDRGQPCTVVKPAQTGLPPEAPGDVEHVVRLAGDAVHAVELARYPEPLSPAAAARATGAAPVDPAACVDAVLRAEQCGDLVLVDGSGGLLVRYDEDGFTVAELARTLRLPVVLVTEAGAAAVNAAALTLEAVAHRGLELSGLVVGRWPASPGQVERSNVADLEMLAARRLLGALPDGVGIADRASFLATARSSLGPPLGGAFDAAAFRRAAA